MLGSRSGGGEGGVALASTVASSSLEPVVCKFQFENSGLSPGCWAFRRHLKAGLMMYMGNAMIRTADYSAVGCEMRFSKVMFKESQEAH